MSFSQENSKGCCFEEKKPEFKKCEEKKFEPCCKHDEKEDYCKCFCKCMTKRPCKFDSKKEEEYDED